MADTAVDHAVAAQDEPVTAVDSSGADEIASAAGDNKRKLDDLEPRDEEDEAPLKKQEVSTETSSPAAVVQAEIGGDEKIDGSHTDEAPVAAADETKADDEVRAQDSMGGVDDAQADLEQTQKDEINGSVNEGDQEVQKQDVTSIENGQLASAEDIQTTSVAAAEAEPTSRRMDVPNSKVGVLIGKGGETIKYLQQNSGAKIQITRDAEADLNSSTRSVELIGTRQCIDKAEKLIKDVIAEADAGGSPALVARGFGTAQSGGDQMEIKVPNEKVGLIIGKGGETIKNLQTRSGARIQLIPQHLPEGDSSKERTVRITGSRKQIDTAKEMIRDAMNQLKHERLLHENDSSNLAYSCMIQQLVRISNDLFIYGGANFELVGFHNADMARPYTSDQHWFHVAKHFHSSLSSTEEGYQALTFAIAGLLWLMPRPSPLSGGYNQQNFRPRGPSTVPQWGSNPPTQPAMGYDYQQRGMYPPQQSTQYRQSYGGYQQQFPPRGGFGAGWDQRPAPGQSTPAGSGYDYYSQGSQVAGTHSSNPMPNPTSSMHPGPMNYNYGQSQTPNYGQPMPTQPNYGQGYNDAKYGSQAPSQQYYGQQPMQSGAYGQQASAPQYGQPQSYNKPAYGVSPQDPQAYGPPRATQPGDPMHQGSAPSYATNAPSQPYPYGSNVYQQQQAPAYNQTYPTSGTTDVYAQQPASYVQQGGPGAPPAYSQGGQPMPAAYAQPGSQPAAYAQYPSTQQNYGDPAAGSANYGYHGGSADAGYGATALTAGYGAAPAGSNQPGYVQTAPNPTGYYEQPAPQQQSGYGSSLPAAAPAAYTKSVSPQPGYGGQYEGAQVYGQP